MIKNFYLKIACLATAILCAASCVDTGELESQLSGLEDRVSALEQTASKVNENTIAIYSMLVEGNIIMEVKAHENGTVYSLELSDGSSVDIYISETGEGITPVIGVDENGDWIYSLDGEEFLPVPGMDEDGMGSAIPQFRVSENFVWEISTDGGATWTSLEDSEGNSIPANPGFSESFFTSVSYNGEDGLELGLATGETVTIPVYQELRMTVDGYEDGATIAAGGILQYDVTFSEDVADAIIMQYPENWRVRITEEGEFIIESSLDQQAGKEEKVTVWLQSAEGYIRSYRFTFTVNNAAPGSTKAWEEFVNGDEDNVLLDFSYAGYDHGESAPPEVIISNESGTYTASNGYTVYNIADYDGADGTDTESDRDAFLALLTDIFGDVATAPKNQNVLQTTAKSSANAIIYFPEGDWILHSAADNIMIDGKEQSQSIVLLGGNYIIKGAGRDKTRIIMAAPNQPTDPQQMYSSPDLLQLKNNAGIQYTNTLAEVTGDSPKGSFSVEVGGTGKINAGDWVCLYMQNNDPDVVAEELYPYEAGVAEEGKSWAITTDGVTVKDLHQVKSASGNTVTFYEPIMHEVKAGHEWRIVSYNHYENVGVEDITFVGNAKEKFDHHLSWVDDGAYKPISMNRMVNSWMRRVDFESVSEACSVIESANVSVYDCVISGNRGHAAIRSQASSRVFIGAVRDRSQGNSMDKLGHNVTGSDPEEVTGQYHAVGVSKESMGAVLWRNTWGSDGCFESHATQPRATLIDCCTGSFRQWRQGGDAVQMPNHLADLTIWNFNNTTPFTDGTWIWWNENDYWWKFLPPIVVGFHGNSIEFDEEQTLRIESNGTPVQPESLYEAQLEERLNGVPSWLQSLKGIANQ